MALEKPTESSVDGEMRSSELSVDAVAAPSTGNLENRQSKLDGVDGVDPKGHVCTTYEHCPLLLVVPSTLSPLKALPMILLFSSALPVASCRGRSSGPAADASLAHSSSCPRKLFLHLIVLRYFSPLADCSGRSSDCTGCQVLPTARDTDLVDTHLVHMVSNSVVSNAGPFGFIELKLWRDSSNGSSELTWLTFLSFSAYITRSIPESGGFTADSVGQTHGKQTYPCRSNIKG
jgi:hypothetical protein